MSFKKLKYGWTLGVLALLQQLAFAQIIVSKTTLDYGKVDVWKNDTIAFTIKNNNNTVAKLLPTYNPTTLLWGPLSIPPYQSVVYKVVAYPAEKGYFEFNPTYYFSNSNDAVKLNIKGFVKKFDDNALFQCPKLSNEPKPFEMPFIQVQIVDAATGRFIYHANTQVSTIENTVKFEGAVTKLRTFYGNYQVFSEAEGYQPKTVDFSFSKTNTTLIVRLEPIMVEPKEEIAMDDHLFEKDSTVQEDEKLVITEEKTTPNDKEKEEIVLIKEKQNADTIVEKVVIKEDKQTDLQLLTHTYKASQLPPQHIIILADVSFSMKRKGYLESLKLALDNTLKSLRSIDSVSVITFSSSNFVLVDHISSVFYDSLSMAIAAIEAQGGTNVKIALKTAYGMADRYAATTQIFLFTDGKFNTPGTPASWYAQYAQERSNDKPYRLNIILFGNNVDDYNFMQYMAVSGKGKALQMNNTQVERVLIEQLIAQ